MPEREEPVEEAGASTDTPDGGSASPAGRVSPESSWLDGVWSVFTSQPGLGVVLMQLDSRIEYVNESFVKDYIKSQKMVGRLISDFLAAPVTTELLAAIKKVSGTDTLLVRKVVYKGYETQVAYRWIPDEHCGDGRILMTVQRGFPDPGEGEGVEVERAGYIDLGNLSVLTLRELEVLALVGEGRRVKEIAATLHRSPKTIESHLSSIYRKVKTSDRAVLMRIAGEAGLDLEMVSRIRVDAVHVDEDDEDG